MIYRFYHLSTYANHPNGIYVQRVTCEANVQVKFNNASFVFIQVKLSAGEVYVHSNTVFIRRNFTCSIPGLRTRT